tara:strand:- start:17428 stop:17727 length:300 start_codon:yes stop_codon:yes gene_type:complete
LTQSEIIKLETELQQLKQGENMENKWYLEYVETRTKLVSVHEDKLSKEQLEIIKDKTLSASDDELIEIFTTVGEITSNDLDKWEVSDYPFKVKKESDNE